MKKASISIIDMPEGVLKNLRTYEIDQMIHVQATNLSWDVARQCLGDYALFRSGPDVSGIGAHLLDHFFHMDVLRSFSRKELSKIGDESVYPASLWREGTQQGGDVYAIPWSMDVRVVYYRRDLVAKAGIDEVTAFASVPNMQDTFAKLQSLEGVSPWVMPTARELTALQNMAMWVWHEGGEFMSADGHHPHFMKPEALAGMKKYFSIYGQAMRPEAQFLSETGSTQCFRDGNAAAVVSGTWMYHPGAEFAPVVAENVGVTTLPVPSFVGAQSLAIWAYSQNEKEAVQLVKHMCQPQTQFDMFVNSGYLPGRLDVIQNPDFFNNKQLADACLDVLESGRGFKAKYMWGLVEDRLATAIHTIWKKLFAEPDSDLEETIMKVMKPVSFQLERMLNP